MTSRIEQAIRDAVEKGYLVEPVTNVDQDRNIKLQAEYPWHFETFCDPAFWQALGKARGWEPDRAGKYLWYLHYGDELYGEMAAAHHLLDHLADGKNAESFFTSLV